MKKIIFALLFLGMTQQSKADFAGVISSEIKCTNKKLILTYSGSAAEDPDSRYNLKIVDENTEYNDGLPDIEEFSNITDTSFKFKSIKEISGGHYTKIEEGTLDTTRYYTLKLQFTQLPKNASKTLLKLAANNKILTFDCKEQTFNPKYE